MTDPIRLEVFKHLFASIAEEMGVVLRRTGYSPNIKERRDYSCALFDAAGNMIAQGAHMPVHLGAMPMSVAAAIEHFGADGFAPGDAVILNDPYRGGTHLPDITLITPIFADDRLIGFAASRAHHADVGGMSPGSMPLSTELYQEGIVIPPLKLLEGERMNRAVWDMVLANVRTPEERAGDLRAQLAACRKGEERLLELVGRYGLAEVQQQMVGLLTYAERMTRRLIAGLPDGVYRFSDVMDDDGIDPGPLTIAVAVTIGGDEAHVDFTGTPPQCRGSINAVEAITVSAVYYVFRCLIGLDIPSNSGCLAPITVLAPPGTLVNAHKPAAVAGGNVETSQRITDVLLGALAQAAPDRVPAASQGTMNNVTVGGWDEIRDRPFAYYETIGGGMGARPDRDGADAIHTHMTNTLNTPVEALEYAYPFRMKRYEIRRGSGGAGRFRGGDGIVREMELLTRARVTILADRRKHGPYGLAGGERGKVGRSVLIRDRRSEVGDQGVDLPGKVSVEVEAGDVISIQTPGGGGFGRPKGAKMKVKKYKSAGGVVLDDAGRVLLLERYVPRADTPGHEIRLPKGHIEKGETPKQAALREVGEESGYWGLEIVADLGKNRVEFEFRGRLIRRKERYYLMRLTDPNRGAPKPSRPDAEEALFEPLWAQNLAEAGRLLTFESEKEFVRRAVKWSA